MLRKPSVLADRRLGVRWSRPKKSAALVALEAAMAAAGPGLGAAAVLFAKVAVGAASYTASRTLIWRVVGQPESIEARALELFRAIKGRIAARSASPRA
ncbi:MAG: hypothetical protein U1E87_08785 [Alphaproteobacteria bacterium]